MVEYISVNMTCALLIIIMLSHNWLYWYINIIIVDEVGNNILNYVKPWWRYQMETFSALLAICAGNSPVPGEFPPKGQWRRVLMYSLICVWINSWVNNRDDGDLRRYRAHYDVIVMIAVNIDKI